MEKGLVPPETVAGMSESEIAPFKTEWDVCSHLSKLGHEIHKISVWDDLSVMRDAIVQFDPQIAFNLLEGFQGNHAFDQHVVSYLELMRQRYTGCNPRGLTLARDKALTKKIMAYHRIAAPDFAVFPRCRRIARPARLTFPLLVKSVNVEGSVGISKASVVHDDQKLRERIEYIHEALGTAAIAEQYIEGRELYVGVIGNRRLEVLPTWELVFEKAPSDMPVMATEQAKWNLNFQRRWGVATRRADDLPLHVAELLPRLCKRIYRLLGLTGYARIDFRLSSQGKLYLLEANPNPNIAADEDFAASAKCAGIGYEPLLQRILNLGLRYDAREFI